MQIESGPRCYSLVFHISSSLKHDKSSGRRVTLYKALLFFSLSCFLFCFLFFFKAAIAMNKMSVRVNSSSVTEWDRLHSNRFTRCLAKQTPRGKFIAFKNKSKNTLYLTISLLLFKKEILFLLLLPWCVYAYATRVKINEGNY